MSASRTHSVPCESNPVEKKARSGPVRMRTRESGTSTGAAVREAVATIREAVPSARNVSCKSAAARPNPPPCKGSSDWTKCRCFMESPGRSPVRREARCTKTNCQRCWTISLLIFARRRSSSGKRFCSGTFSLAANACSHFSFAARMRL